jgi:hypothetical protein
MPISEINWLPTKERSRCDSIFFCLLTALVLLSLDLTHFLVVVVVTFLLLHCPQFNIPKGGMLSGTRFGYGDASPFSKQWETPEGLFDLSVTGDQFFLYCLDVDDLPNFITGFSYNGAWMEAEDIQAMDEVPLDMSALPEDLFEFGSVFLPHAVNHLYNGTRSGFLADVLIEFMNPLNYEASEGRFVENETYPWFYATSDTSDTLRFRSGALSLFSALVVALLI